MEVLRFVYSSSSVAGLVLTSNPQFWVNSGGDWDDNWGQSFLGELYNQCGGSRVTDWSFWFAGDGNNYNDGNAYFVLLSGWPDKCVENAIYWSSYNTGAISGVTCQWQS